MLEASHHDANTAYAAIDRHRLEDNEPYIYRTHNGGKTWQKITTGLPAGVYMQTVKEDTERRGLLFDGTELGVFVSFDDGEHWQSLQLNLPPCSMRDLAVKDNDLIVATHGRGFWILDNITPLRQLTSEIARSDVYLFRPADTMSVPPGDEYGTPKPRDEALAANPPYGVMIDYYLRKPVSGPLTIEILDLSGELIRRYSSEDKPPAVDSATLNVPAFWRQPTPPLSTEPGMHRWLWDLKPTPVANPRRATAANRNPETRMPPGKYNVRLTANGRSYLQPLIVVMDPRAK